MPLSRELRNFRSWRQFNFPETMKREEDQELWDLLGRAAPPSLSPFFARNVARQIRQEPGWRDRLSWWFAPRRLIPAGALAAAVIAAAVSFESPRSAPATVSSSSDDPATMQLDPIDYQVVVDLDALLAMEEDNLWSDADTPTL